MVSTPTSVEVAHLLVYIVGSADVVGIHSCVAGVVQLARVGARSAGLSSSRGNETNSITTASVTAAIRGPACTGSSDGNADVSGVYRRRTRIRSLTWVVARNASTFLCWSDPPLERTRTLTDVPTALTPLIIVRWRTKIIMGHEPATGSYLPSGLLCQTSTLDKNTVDSIATGDFGILAKVVRNTSVVGVLCCGTWVTAEAGVGARITSFPVRGLDETRATVASKTAALTSWVVHVEGQVDRACCPDTFVVVAGPDATRIGG